MSEPTTRELGAAIAAARELGPEYDDAVAERLARHLEERDDHDADDDGSQLVLPLASIGLGIPITGAASAFDGSAGTIVAVAAWLAIAAINVAHALPRRR